MAVLGSTLNRIDIADFKTKFPVLSALDLPVVFLAPPEIFNDQNFETAIMFQASKIETNIISENVNVRDSGEYIFAKGLMITMDITDCDDKGGYSTRVGYDLASINARSGHLLRFEGADGCAYYNLSFMLDRIKRTGHVS